MKLRNTTRKASNVTKSSSANNATEHINKYVQKYIEQQKNGAKQLDANTNCNETRGNIDF